jgi:sortase A
MKNSGSKAFLVAILLGCVLVASGIWFGFLSSYLKAGSNSEKAKELFATPSQLPVAKTAATPNPLVNGAPEYGGNFAVMRIPSLGPDWVRTISQGTSLEVLDGLGIGHYNGTQLPGEPGNFAVAGHSGNKWTPFAKYQEIETGDLIQIETFDTNFTYEVIETVTVNDTDMKTVYENPSIKSDADGQSWLTITTCVTDGPKDKRIAIYAKLVSEGSKE